MSDDIWQRDEVDSPCVKICIIHPESGLCLGCCRSIDEISRWSGMTPEERRQVTAERGEAEVDAQRRQPRRDVQVRPWPVAHADRGHQAGHEILWPQGDGVEVDVGFLAGFGLASQIGGEAAGKGADQREQRDQDDGAEAA